MSVSITLLIGLAVWIVGASQTSQRRTTTQNNQPNVSAQPKGVSRFEVYDWGTLKALWDSTGKQVYSPEKSANEGYSIVYQVLGGAAEKQLQGVFAIGKTFSKTHFAEKEMAIKKVRVGDIEITCVTETTADKILRIDSNYYIDPRTKALNVIRLIKNISKSDVRLVAVRTLHDSGLRPIGQTRFGPVNPKTIKVFDLSKDGIAHSTVKMPNDFAFGLLDLSAYPELPCVYCPPNCYESLSVNPGEVKGYCVACNDKGDIIYDPLKANCPTGATVVKVEGWDRLPASIVSEGQWGTICVSCKGGNAEPLTVSGAGGGVPNPTVEEYKRGGKCQFHVDFDRGPRKTPADLKPGDTHGIGQGVTH